MVKKIINWVFGSFFRSVGRFLFWLLLGSAFTILISKLDLHIPDFVRENLLMRVSASEITFPSNSHTNFYGWKSKNSIGNSYETLANVSLGDSFKFNNSTTPGLNTNWFVDGFANYVPYSYKEGNSYTIKYIIAFNSSVAVEEQLISDGTTKFDIYGVTPSNSTYSNSYFSSTSYSYRKVASTNNNRFEFTFNFTTKADVSNVRLRVMFYWGSAYCSYQSYDGYCGRSISNISYVSGSMTFEEGINSVIQNQTNIIENNFNEVNNNINDLNNTLNDDNVDDANSTANSFFGSFSSNDPGGLSGIITTPLVLANKMLDNTCSPISTTFHNRTISFPCGDILWGRPGASALKDFLNLCYGGFVCYGILVSMFKLVDNLKNPENDRIEVEDL